MVEKTEVQRNQILAKDHTASNWQNRGSQPCSMDSLVSFSAPSSFLHWLALHLQGSEFKNEKGIKLVLLCWPRTFDLEPWKTFTHRNNYAADKERTLWNRSHTLVTISNLKRKMSCFLFWVVLTVNSHWIKDHSWHEREWGEEAGESGARAMGEWWTLSKTKQQGKKLNLKISDQGKNALGVMWQKKTRWVTETGLGFSRSGTTGRAHRVANLWAVTGMLRNHVWNRVESPEISPWICGQLILDRARRTHDRERMVSSTGGAGKSGYPQAKE